MEAWDGSSPGCVLGFWVDGNVVQMAEVAHAPGESAYNIRKLRCHEEDDLLEMVERVRHPIFMDVTCSHFPNPRRLKEITHRLLDAMQPSTLKTIGCLAGETVRLYQGQCKGDWASFRALLGSLLRHLHTGNPLHYPAQFCYRRYVGTGDNDGDAVLLSVSHASEMRAFREMLNQLPLEVIAYSNSRQAMAAMNALLGDPAAQEAYVLTDVGRLRTHYTGLGRSRLLFSHAIPVGLARDDIHFFRSIPRRMDLLFQLNANRGPLLLAPDVTPPLLFDPAFSSPQLDCTRSALQVARYLSRAVQAFTQTDTPIKIRRYVLTGLASRLPGYRQFLREKTGFRLVRPERLKMPGVKLGDGIDPKQVGDYIIPIGATLRALGSSPTGLTATPFGRLPIELEKRIALDDLEEGQLYQINAPFEIV
jgi:hypothetical protein